MVAFEVVVVVCHMDPVESAGQEFDNDQGDYDSIDYVAFNHFPGP